MNRKPLQFFRGKDPFKLLKLKATPALGICGILGAGLLWGSMGLFVRYFSGLGCSSMEIVAVRMLSTFLLLLPATAILCPSLLKVRFRDLWCFIGTGMCSIVFFNLCYFSTITQTSLATAAVLLYTAPMIVTVLAAILFRERMTAQKIAACLLAFIGCVFVSGIGELRLTPLALLTGLGSGLGYALYSIFGRYAIRRGYSSLTITVYTFLFASLAILPLTDLKHTSSVLSSGAMPVVTALLMGLLVSVLPYLLYTFGLSVIESGKASVMASVEPVTAAVIGLAVYGEVPGLSEFFGMLLVLVSVVLINLRADKKTTKPKD